MPTLKEHCPYLHRFQSLAAARRIIGELIARYNTEWLIERLGHQTPMGARARAKAAGAMRADRIVPSGSTIEEGDHRALSGSGQPSSSLIRAIRCYIAFLPIAGCQYSATCCMAATTTC